MIVTEMQKLKDEKRLLVKLTKSRFQRVLPTYNMKITAPLANSNIVENIVAQTVESIFTDIIANDQDALNDSESIGSTIINELTKSDNRTQNRNKNLCNDTVFRG